MTPFILILAVLIIVIVVKRRRKTLRKREMEKFAQSVYMPFDLRAARLPDLSNNNFPVLQSGYAGEFSCLITGGGMANAFFVDYTYITASRASRYKSITFAVLEFPRELPQFAMSPENFLDRIEQAMGVPDINIDGYPVFSKLYKLSSPDYAPVLAFFNPRLIAYFEKNPGWCVQASGRRLLAFKGEKLVPVAEYRAFMDEARALADAITNK